VRRPIYAIVLICLLALTIPALIAAQDAQPPVTTEEPAPPVVQPTIVTPEVIAPAVPEGVVPIPTAIGGELVPTAAPQPTTPPPAIDPIALPLLLSARSDLELLAGQELGAERPVGWSGSLDVNDPQLALLTRLDLELLVGRLIAPDQRPPGWFGAVPSSTLAIVRDIRHDLELLADTVGVPSVRPAGWTGADPLMRCDRGVQALINVLERGGVFSLNVDGNDPNFCMLAEVQASQFAETSLQNTTITTTINNPAAPAPAGQPAPLPGSVQIDTEVAFAFLNRFGTEQVGKIPVGTNVQPVARSFTQFSAMTLVRGQDFEVFIDYRDSSLSDDQFAALPDVNGVSVTTACGAAWCDSVIYTLGNPAAGRTEPPGQPVASGNTTSANSNTSGKTQVPIENLILAYDGQDANNSTVVRMQLCSGSATTAGNICQPVTQVIAPDGSVLQPVGNLNGQSQYRLPYGYSTHSARSANYFLVDVWIHTPEQR
jgi:hypothetical protein